MKRTGQTLEDLFIEITFAEDGISGTLKPEGGPFESLWGRTFTAVALAEAGEFAEARVSPAAGGRDNVTRGLKTGRRARLCTAHP